MKSSAGFHTISGPEIGYLPKVVRDKSITIECIDAFLESDEEYSWDGPYNTREPLLATRPGQSLGRLFVTTKRLIFWSDDFPKPHLGIYYEDIQGWKTTWMPLASRGVFITVSGKRYLFAANATAVKNAERLLNFK